MMPRRAQPSATVAIEQVTQGQDHPPSPGKFEPQQPFDIGESEKGLVPVPSAVLDLARALAALPAVQTALTSGELLGIELAQDNGAVLSVRALHALLLDIYNHITTEDERLIASMVLSAEAQRRPSAFVFSPNHPARNTT